MDGIKALSGSNYAIISINENDVTSATAELSLSNTMKIVVIENIVGS